MFLKSLTLRGFKSFADKATLEFEPGVTVVVGPNGAGKSNVVDAVAWVLGAQGPRTMRGAKMDDVIFAGTRDRPALGRAEVELVIDNSAGLLPIDFSEVSIKRTLFRNGDSEYQINGATCRLLDVQELLSDSRIGRTQHIIVSQGQVDAVLNSRPEDRRAIIEEAAGVLKYRKRKEKAERRLLATEQNMLRLQDLLREVRRQLRPLERQADAARRHGGLVEELRGIRMYLSGREFEALSRKAERTRVSRGELAAIEAELLVRLRTLDAAVAVSETQLVPSDGDDLTDLLTRMEALRERSRGLGALLAEKSRGVAREVARVADEGVVETLAADASLLRAELVAVERDALTLAPEVESIESAELTAREARLELEATSGDSPLNVARRAEENWRHAESEVQQWKARAETLALALDQVRAASGAASLVGLPGVIGPIVDHLEIEPGTEAAVTAALGETISAVVVAGSTQAADALGRLKEGGLDALLVVLEEISAPFAPVLAPIGTRALADCVRAKDSRLGAAVGRLLAPAVLVEGGWQAALDVVVAQPGLIAVTRDGDRLGGSGAWRVGGAGAAGVSTAALENARDAVAASEVARDAAERSVAAARLLADQSRGEVATLESTAIFARRALEVRAAGIAERRTVLKARLEGIEARLAERPDAKSVEARLAQVGATIGALDLLGRHLEIKIAEIESLVESLRASRRAQSDAARGAVARLEVTRSERSGVERELLELRERASRLEIEDAENRLRIETATETIRREFDCEPSDAEGSEQPEVPQGTTAAARVRELERELRLMGAINPLALQEFEALTERHVFLDTQLEDVRKARRELGRLIRTVDEEIVETFKAAYEDVAGHFTSLFETLFPGGSGRILLTDPENILETGVELEARPSGKNVRRLSLLSGGERSLTALAFLFAVFRSRPSPFYLLDEVEAALDDVNLHRFLDLIAEFRNDSQLVVVSHQKRTMEAADSLYGVSMPPGGSSRVISHKVSRSAVDPTLIDLISTDLSSTDLSSTDVGSASE